MKKKRLEALVDAIFAIAMTILVLGIDAPTGTMSVQAMDAYIRGLASDLYSYCLSFLLLGVFWWVNHMHFEKLEKVDTGFIWINIVWLMVVVLVPFSTKLTGNYGDLVTPNILFHLNMLTIGLLLSMSWIYTQRNGLMDIGENEYRLILKKNLLMPLAAILALILTPIAPEYSSTAYAVLILKRLL